MASPFQQQSLRRKIIYVVSIVVLFSASIVLRQVGDLSLDQRAQALEIREEDKGEVELTGSAIRLSLVGFRGFAVCYLWSTAADKQMKNRWNELELIIRSIMKLQPHYITPWLFQSWNLAYNVSVESDRIADKYFYITRGIELLAEGERQNKNNPDLRYNLGWYNQHKIGLSDEANTFRCLYQMSCIDPLERDKERLQAQSNGRMANFEQFCRDHPMLVRRLRDALTKVSSTDVIDFLDDNKDIPSRFEDKPIRSASEQQRSPLKDPDKQFPLLPPLEADDQGDRADPSRPDFDNYQVARDWYRYAVQPLPPSTKELGPGVAPFDATKYRLPRSMLSILFRGYPSRAQSYVAENLEREGWFGEEGWKITGEWFADDKFQDGKDAIVGERDWAVPAWTRAHEMWKAHGERNGLHLEKEDRKSLEDLAEKYRKRFNLQIGDPPVGLPPELRGTDIEEALRAYSRLWWYERYRGLTNFPHFYAVSLVESNRETVDVRKSFFLADQLHTDRRRALPLYVDAFQRWKKILLAHPEFRRDVSVQEDTYEIELKYLNLAGQWLGPSLKQLYVETDYLTQALFRPPGVVLWVPSYQLAQRVPPPVVSPLEMLTPEEREKLQPDEKGLISAEIKGQVRSRLGLPSLTPPRAPPSGMPMHPSRRPGMPLPPGPPDGRPADR